VPKEKDKEKRKKREKARSKEESDASVDSSSDVDAKKRSGTAIVAHSAGTPLSLSCVLLSLFHSAHLSAAHHRL
jgi:hypothetical protein